VTLHQRHPAPLGRDADERVQDDVKDSDLFDRQAGAPHIRRKTRWRRAATLVIPALCLRRRRPASVESTEGQAPE
jgi:hypothetical protein